MWTDAGRLRVLTERVSVACARCGAEVKVTLIRRNQENHCRPCQKRLHAEQEKARYKKLRAAGMTPAEWKKPKKPGRRAAEGSIVILYDPCDAPMAAGCHISFEEYEKGLHLGAFVAGTVFKMPGGWVEVAGWER